MGEYKKEYKSTIKNPMVFHSKTPKAPKVISLVTSSHDNTVITWQHSERFPLYTAYQNAYTAYQNATKKVSVVAQ